VRGRVSGSSGRSGCQREAGRGGAAPSARCLGPAHCRLVARTRRARRRGVLAWQLFGTGRETHAAQEALLEGWDVEPAESLLAGEDDLSATEAPMEAVDPGEALAVLQFARPGGDAPIEGPLAVVEGVRVRDLRQGPGHRSPT
jgi:hypothetical protein